MGSTAYLVLLGYRGSQVLWQGFLSGRAGVTFNSRRVYEVMSLLRVEGNRMGSKANKICHLGSQIKQYLHQVPWLNRTFILALKVGKAAFWDFYLDASVRRN